MPRKMPRAVLVADLIEPSEMLLPVLSELSDRSLDVAFFGLLPDEGTHDADWGGRLWRLLERAEKIAERMPGFEPHYLARSEALRVTFSSLAMRLSLT